jgi:hypothetical protein
VKDLTLVSQVLADQAAHSVGFAVSKEAFRLK